MIDTAQQIMILEQILKFNKKKFFLHHLLNQLIFGKTKKKQDSHTLHITTHTVFSLNKF